MLTHPGTAILPAALVAAEMADASGEAFLVAVAAAYEVMERMAAEFIPTVMSRGFHPVTSPITRLPSRVSVIAVSGWRHWPVSVRPATSCSLPASCTCSTAWISAKG